MLDIARSATDFEAKGILYYLIKVSRLFINFLLSYSLYISLIDEMFRMPIRTPRRVTYSILESGYSFFKIP
jgi:hypothetical protein